MIFRSRSVPCIFIAILTINTGGGQSQDEYTDENRPYKFGFNIQGYQHRQEEKDKKGIIKGEYGFITADGYYRVTVYATDENGDFRIISMKNYYVGFPPEDPTTTPQPPSQSNRAQAPKPRDGSAGNQPPFGGRNAKLEKQADKEPIEVKGLSACSSCLIPTTTKAPVRKAFGNQLEPNQNPTLKGRTQQGDARNAALNGNYPVRTSQFPDAPGTSPRLLGANEGETNSRFPQKGDFPHARKSAFDSGHGQTSERGKTPENRISTKAGGNGNAQRNGPTGDRNGFSNQRDSNRGPNANVARDGLPEGVTVDDIKALLYTFNYTVGFHGHHEDGYRNGDKEGDYFFDGRDGVERKVEYLANEFGYQPNITFVDLPENDSRRPNEKTEKEYGLKGYEFKWFYRK